MVFAIPCQNFGHHTYVKFVVQAKTLRYFFLRTMWEQCRALTHHRFLCFVSVMHMSGMSTQSLLEQCARRISTRFDPLCARHDVCHVRALCLDMLIISFVHASQLQMNFAIARSNLAFFGTFEPLLLLNTITKFQPDPTCTIKGLTSKSAKKNEKLFTVHFRQIAPNAPKLQ